MRICVLMGSPRERGNTAVLTQAFLDQWGQLGLESQVIPL